MLRRVGIALAIALAATAIALALGTWSFAETIELKTYDLRMRATAHVDAPHDQIVLVNIDDDSIRRIEPLFGRWPWPRVVHASAIDFLSRAPARVILYDVTFSEADKTKFMIGAEEWTGEESDRALADSIGKAGNVILAGDAALEDVLDPAKQLALPLDGVPGLSTRYQVDDCIDQRPLILPPLPRIAQAALGVAHTFVPFDSDGPIRRVAPFVRIGERVIPSLPVAAAMTALSLRPDDVRVEANAFVMGRSRFPLVAQTVPDFYGAERRVCRQLLPFQGPVVNTNGQPTFKSYSFYDLVYAEEQILEGATPHVDPTVFKDRIVLVGASAQGLHDTKTVPFDIGEMQGAEIHANMLAALLESRSIAPAAIGVTFALTIGAALLVTLAGLRANAWITAAVAAVIALLITWGSVRAFDDDLWVPLVMPLLAVALAFVGDLSWQYFVEGREKRKVKKLFSRYVPKDVYEQLMADPERAALGGRRRMMTVLFSDVRGFTAMSEKASPEEVVAQLNEYFSRMVDVLFEHRGTLDKFVGDMVMGLFGAPLDDEDHADHAVQAALAMSRALDELNAQWRQAGRPELDIGIGISTGEMVAGNIGSTAIMSYTVIGDTVNLGARLESLNKDYGTRIIISEATRAALKGRYDSRPLGDVTVKGKSRPIAIYEVKPS